MRAHNLGCLARPISPDAIAFSVMGASAPEAFSHLSRDRLSQPSIHELFREQLGGAFVVLGQREKRNFHWCALQN
jgi:hypothetical protein